MKNAYLLAASILFLPIFVNGDGNDWVNPTYVLQAATSPNSKTSSARSKIISYAGASAKNGPWTVSTGTSVRPPNGDPRDYLSWAPYHWPDCNWCANPRTHLSTGTNVTRNGTESQGDTTDTSQCDNDGSCTSNDSWGSDDGNYDDGDEAGDGEVGSDGGDESSSADENAQTDSDDTSTSDLSTSKILAHTRMLTSVKRSWSPRSADAIKSSIANAKSHLPLDSLPSFTTSFFDLSSTQSSTTTDDSDVMSGPPDGALDAGKTTKPKAKPTTSNKAPPNTKAKPSPTQNAKCTPSPTKSLAPSATWTTCPYVVRDGKLNPDVRMLNGVNAVADVTQSVLYNALAAILVPASASAKTYAKNAATFIQIFFLDPKAGVYPELQYGQLIRGPGKEVGQYLGILDFRGMVKVANAIQLMRNAKIPDWTTTLDSQMVAWSNKYVQWLTTSDLGKQAGSAPNNHGSFYANQVAAINILVGDADGARTALQTYFQNQFKDQIAASGEQPFEAVRTRPYHYRCFNLEAMITNAKLGDYLGVDFWTARSKYGATIQTALDYTMALSPGKESIVDIFPHVEAVAAVYGDPTGKYAAFLTKNFPAYASATYYFYDQPEAFNVSPTSSSKGGKEVLDATEPHQLLEEGGHPVADEVTTTAKPPQGGSDDDPDDPLPAPTISFACPAAFATGTEVQLDDGIYVTCDELKPFYGYVEEEDS